MRPSAGITFGGRYELLSRIAIGGMGEVWQATDLVIGRPVAIKILKDEYLGDPGFVERFRAEARHAALVNHEGIANVYDYGEEDGSAYLVMELVPGEALSTILEREKALPVTRVLDIVAQTASALSAAHQAGLVHRDIKPGNMLITPDGRVKITDFGIARIADQVPLTATGQVMGTVQYLSPEQASGHPASPSTDIYSLGIVAYEAVSGRRPFSGESQVAIAMAQINETPPELPDDIPEPVRNLIYSAIAKKAENRPASALALANAARALLRGDVTAAALAVPAVLSGGATPTQETRLLGVLGNDDRTTVLPAAPGDYLGRRADVRASARENRPRTGLIVAISLASALVLSGIVVAAVMIAGNNAAQKPTPTPSETPTVTDTPTPTPTATRTPVNQDDYKGQNVEQAATKLQSFGLVVNKVLGEAAPTTDAAGQVYMVNPTGPLEAGATVTLTYYGPAPVLAKPTGTVAITGPSTLSSGVLLAASWPAQTCPAGATLTGYRLQVNGTASITNGVNIPAGVTSAQVKAGAAGSSFTLQFAFVCGQIVSPWSDESTPITIPTPSG